MTNISTALALLMLAITGCVETPVRYAPPPVPPPGMVRDSQTIHNVEATRIWVIRGDAGSGEQRIIFCDAAMLQGQAPTLCVMWPPR